MPIGEQAALDGKQGRFLFIDGLKGITCVMIMVSHYSGVVTLSLDMTCFPFITWLSGSIFSTFISAFWLNLFFIASGFLLSYAEIDNLKDLVKRIIKRFLRFYLPILAACFIIYIFAITIGFHNGQTVSLFTNGWFQGFYSSNITLWDIVIDPLKTVLLGTSEFNSPYWVIRDMFFSSILIYLINLLRLKIKASKVLTVAVYVVAIAITGFTLGSVFSGCLTGALCGRIIKDFGDRIKSIPQTFNTIVCIFCALIPFGLHNVLLYGVKSIFEITGLELEILYHIDFSNSIWSILYFAIFVVMISGNKKIKNILSCKFLCDLNKISFGIYSFHWPLICSVGALLMLQFPVKTGIILGWIVSMMLTIIVSIFYHIVFENNISKILKKIS